MIELLKETNERVNASTTWKPDGEKDVWQTPEQTMLLGCGDCEDFAILKWSELRKQGVEGWLAYTIYNGDSFSGRTAHMVLLVEHDSRWWVLDNLFSDISTIEDRPELALIYRFNETGIIVNGDDGRLRELKSLPAFEKILKECATCTSTE